MKGFEKIIIRLFGLGTVHTTHVRKNRGITFTCDMDTRVIDFISQRFQ